MDPRRKYLLVCDFDQTLFETFTPPLGGMDTLQAYASAVTELFGEEGSEIYQAAGGLKNRSPGEVISAILSEKSDLGTVAYEIWHENFIDLLPWNFSDPTAVMTEMLVQLKLQCLLGQISIEWPMPYPGVIGFFKKIEILRMEDRINIDFAILSSGHTDFIKKTFGCWGLSPPKVMITDDDLRHLERPPLHNRVKPAPFPFALTQLKWLRSLNGNKIGHTRQGMIYIGDDPKKDGGLAKNVNVPFGFFNPRGILDESCGFPDSSFAFAAWDQVGNFLCHSETKSRFLQGQSCRDIFSHFFEIS